MTRREAQNAIRALSFVDRHQVPALADGAAWQAFRSNPAAFFARAEDETADAIWAAAMPKREEKP